MPTIIFSIIAFISTLLGGLVSIRFKDKLHLILGFTAGVILGLVSFDILPEIFKLVGETNTNTNFPMLALVSGFMVFHLLEKMLLVHHNQEENYGDHKHPEIGVFSAMALALHSFFDGIGIGLGFQVSSLTGILVAIAVIGHDFSDGLNTGALMLIHKNDRKRTIIMILIDAIAPVLGGISTLFFKIPDKALVIYLGFFAGFLLYICLEDILPEAHNKSRSLAPVLMTIIGLVFIYGVINFIG